MSITTKTQKITPELAQRWLKEQYNFRHPRVQRVLRFRP